MEGKRKGSAKKKTVQIEQEPDNAFVEDKKKRAVVKTHGIDNVIQGP